MTTSGKHYTRPEKERILFFDTMEKPATFA